MRIKIFFENICCILATAPLLTIDILKQGLELLIEKGADSVRPVVRFGYPIQRAFKMDGNSFEFLSPICTTPFAGFRTSLS